MTTATTVRPVPIDPVTARKLATTAAKAAQNTVERDKLIAEAYRAGASMREIGRAIGMTHPGVRSILIRDNVYNPSRRVSSVLVVDVRPVSVGRLGPGADRRSPQPPQDETANARRDRREQARPGASHGCTTPPVGRRTET